MKNMTNIVQIPTDSEFNLAGFSESEGIAMWANPQFPEIEWIDCNAVAISIYMTGKPDPVILNEDIAKIFKKVGLPVVLKEFHI